MQVSFSPRDGGDIDEAHALREVGGTYKVHGSRFNSNDDGVRVHLVHKRTHEAPIPIEERPHDNYLTHFPGQYGSHTGPQTLTVRVGAHEA